VAAIGPVTRDACARVGLPVHVMPARYTIAALVDALIDHFRRDRS
jgi:uroporphyrinogen-III synthase